MSFPPKFFLATSEPSPRDPGNQNGDEPLETLAILVVEPPQLRRVDVEHSAKDVVLQDRNDDLGARRGVACNVAWEGAHVGDDDRLAAGGRRAAHPLADRDPNARGLALEGAEHELVAAEQIEAAPVDPRERVSQEPCGVGEVREGVEFRMVHAVHSSGTSGAGKDANFPSDPCGYVLTFEDGFRIYFAGDTNVFADMALIGELYEPDLALLPIGDFYTMGPREAAKACQLLGVSRVIPMHWGTFPILTGTPGDLLREIDRRGLATEVIELTPGGSWP